MSDKFFLDSNVVLYLLDEAASEKKAIALRLIKRIGYISPQVVFECFNISLRKLKLTRKVALQFVRSLVQSSYLQIENRETIENAFLIFDKYRLQSYDSKIVAAALQAECTILYSEDMQHGLVIENRLTILNPFLK